VGRREEGRGGREGVRMKKGRRKRKGMYDAAVRSVEDVMRRGSFDTPHPKRRETFQCIRGVSLAGSRGLQSRSPAVPGGTALRVCVNAFSPPSPPGEKKRLD